MNEFLMPQEASNPLPTPARADGPQLEHDDVLMRELTGISDADVEALSAAPAPGASVPERGTELHGRIAGQSGDGVFIETGLRSQVLVPLAQFGGNGTPENGKEVDVVIAKYDSSSDLLHANLKGAVVSGDVDSLMQGTMINARAIGMIKGGLEMQIGKLRAFLPASHVDTHRVKDISEYLGQTLRCEIIELGKDRRNIIVSRKKIVQQERAEAREKLLADLAPGQEYDGTVKNLAEFGAFVDIGGIHGLVHVSDMRWTPVEKPSDVVSEGDKVRVKVLKVNRERNRISLGLKQVTPDPWTDVDQRFPEGTQLAVRVVKLAPYGAFAEVTEGVTGLIPTSEMSWDNRPVNPAEFVEVGRVVDVKVLNVDMKRRRIGLSMKQRVEDPWAGLAEAFPANSIMTGKVTKNLEFGALVELKAGVEGLVHISELAHAHVRAVEDVVKIGDEVTVKVLGVDLEKRRVSLSIRGAIERPAPVEPPAGEGARSVPSAAPVKPDKPKRKKPLRGGLASHFEW
ncbi:MAG: S1 RNA-binding domain-containing protein [Phycisphaerales bacterium]|nr:S1 RNA-binding domain-containing protein [Phycisphaerales bacterium]